jgi:hypothetical protein
MAKDKKYLIQTYGCPCNIARMIGLDKEKTPLRLIK